MFASVAQSGRRALAGHNLLLSHSPYSNSAELDDSHHRYDQWRLPRLGAWLLHGHTHSSTRRGDHTIHVGLDAWVNSSPLGRPVRSRDASCIR